MQHRCSSPRYRVRCRETRDVRDALERQASVSASQGALKTVGPFWRSLAPIVGLCCLGVLASCATVVPPPVAKEGPEYAMAVVPARYPPNAGFGGRSYGDTLVQGAVAGAGAGALSSALLLGIGAVVFPPLGVPLALGMAPVPIGGGAIA